MSSQTIGRPIEILLVEDTPGDVRLAVEALKESKMHHNVGRSDEHVALRAEESLTTRGGGENNVEAKS
jgi:hypothetical protein